MFVTGVAENIARSRKGYTYEHGKEDSEHCGSRISRIESDSGINSLSVKPKTKNQTEKCGTKNCKVVLAEPKKHKPLYSCFYCGWTAKFKSWLITHVQRHLRLRCPYCSFEAESLLKLPKHIESEHSECELRNFHTKCRLMKRRRENPVACELCGYRCYSSSGLSRHTLRHSDNDFKCPECPFASFRMKQFTEHLGTLHNVEIRLERTYVCQICNNNSKTMAAFHEHMLSHYRVQTFKCPQCSFTTYVNPKLKLHLKTHTDTRYACELCDFKTKHLRSLRCHVNASHTRSKWFKCYFCDYRSLTQGSVRVHERRHTGERRFACDLCSFRSKTLSGQKSHRRFVRFVRFVRLQCCDEWRVTQA